MPLSHIGQLIEEFKKETSPIYKKIEIIYELDSYMQVVGGSDSDIDEAREFLQRETLNPNERIAEAVKKVIKRRVNWYNMLDRIIADLHKKCMPILTSILVRSLYPSVRTSTAKALGEVGSTLLINQLVTTLNNDNPLIRKDAVSVLNKICSADTVNPLVVAASDDTPIIKRFAASALNQTDSPDTAKAVNILVNALIHYDNPFSKINAARILGKIGGNLTVAVIALIQFAKKWASRDVAYQKRYLGSMYATIVALKEIQKQIGVHVFGFGILSQYGSYIIEPPVIKRIINLANSTDKVLNL